MEERPGAVRKGLALREGVAPAEAMRGPHRLPTSCLRSCGTFNARQESEPASRSTLSQRDRSQPCVGSQRQGSAEQEGAVSRSQCQDQPVSLSRHEDLQGALLKWQRPCDLGSGTAGTGRGLVGLSSSP